MGLSIGQGIGIPFKKSSQNWSIYWESLISATVETAAPTHVVLTFPAARTSLVATDFTCTVNGSAVVVSSASWVGSVLTLVLASAVIFGDDIVITFGKTRQTITVTNNVNANYYVALTGSNTSPYNTPAKAATAIDTVMAYLRTNGSGAGEVISIDAGTFSTANDYLKINSAKLNNLTVVGAGKDKTIISNATSSNCLWIALGTNVKFRKFTISAPSGAMGYRNEVGSNEATLEDINIIQNANNAPNIRTFGGVSTFKNCGFYKNNYDYPVWATGASELNFKNCLFSSNGGNITAGSQILLQTTGDVTIDHCNIFDSYTHTISCQSTGNTVIKNSIIQGPLLSLNTYTIHITNPNVTLKNNFYIPSMTDKDHENIFGSYTDGGGNLVCTANSLFTEYPKKGYIMPRIDDSGALAYAQQMETVFRNNGITATWYIIGATWDVANNAALRQLVANGIIEIGSHSYSHSDLSLTGKIFDITKGAETITIDRTADTITLSGGGSVSGFKTKSLATIKTELEALGATVTGTSIYGTTAAVGKVCSNALGEVIANGSAVNQIDLLIDNTAATGYFKSEIADQKAWLTNLINADGDVIDGQTGAKYECRTFGFPFLESSADSRLAVLNAGYVAGRGQYAAIPFVTNIDMYQLHDMGWTDIIGVDEATTRRNARIYAFGVAQSGAIIGLLSHSTIETPIESMGWIIDEFKKFGSALNVLSTQKFRDEITGGDWTDDGDGTFSRKYDAVNGNYTLLATSTLIDQGDDGGNIGIV